MPPISLLLSLTVPWHFCPQPLLFPSTVESSLWNQLCFLIKDAASPYPPLVFHRLWLFIFQALSQTHISLLMGITCAASLCTCRNPSISQTISSRKPFLIASPVNLLGPFFLNLSYSSLLLYLFYSNLVAVPAHKLLKGKYYVLLVIKTCQKMSWAV